jgi:hypothetical protein
MFAASLPATASEKRRAYSWDSGARVLAFAGSRKGSEAAYLVDELACEGGRGFQLTKVAGGTDGEATGYAVFIAPGAMSCECKSWLTRGFCRHVEMLVDLIVKHQL